MPRRADKATPDIIGSWESTPKDAGTAPCERAVRCFTRIVRAPVDCSDAAERGMPMSTKATKVSVAAAPSTHSQLVREATQAAQDAAAASQRATRAANVVRRAAALATEALRGARDAQQAADEARAAERVASDAAKAARSAAAGAARAVRSLDDEVLSTAIDRSAHYVVTYNGQLVATFLNEDDALLFESELADLDRAHGVTTANCEVLVRRSGHRVGGFMVTAGRLFAFLRDEAGERKAGGTAPRD